MILVRFALISHGFLEGRTLISLRTANVLEGSAVFRASKKNYPNISKKASKMEVKIMKMPSNRASESESILEDYFFDEFYGFWWFLVSQKGSQNS